MRESDVHRSFWVAAPRCSGSGAAWSAAPTTPLGAGLLLGRAPCPPHPGRRRWGAGDRHEATGTSAPPRSPRGVSPEPCHLRPVLCRQTDARLTQLGPQSVSTHKSQPDPDPRGSLGNAAVGGPAEPVRGVPAVTGRARGRSRGAGAVSLQGRRTWAAGAGAELAAG